MAFPRSGEDRLFRFSKAEWEVCKALEPSRVESSDNFFSRARQHLDLHGTAGITEASSPSSRVCLGVEITDKNIRSSLHHPLQLAHHRSQVTDVSESERTDNKVENL